MELRVLAYFLAVAREENFTKAAKQLHVTQPTLSRQIAELEEELGTKLFIRSNHNIVLTESGMLLKRRAQEIISLADKTRQDFLGDGKTLEGTVTVGSGEFLSTEILAGCISNFKAEHPLVRFEIHSGNAGNIKDSIERGLLDIGLMTEPVDIRKYEFITMPVKEQWSALVKDGSPLSGKEYITPADLDGLPVILPANILVETIIKKWAGPYFDKLNVVAKGNLLYNEAILAKSGIGTVITMKMNCSYDGLHFVPLSPTLESTTALAWKKEQVFSSAASAFIEYAKKYVLSISDHDL